jgi:ubiquinone/menaquinone biosynthesis C-methylase UbiE
MTDPDYEYRGLIASNWDLLRGDTSNWEDRFFFLDVIRASGSPALDVGCGTGRLLLDFMEQGIEIEGVDNSPQMIALLHEKAAKMSLQPIVYLQQMEELDLPKRYKTIIVPSSSFQLLTNLDAAHEAMRRFCRHLLPEGTLAMPFMVLWTTPASKKIVRQDWDEDYGGAPRRMFRPEDGAEVTRRSRSTFDLENQLESTEDQYEVTLNGEVIASEYYSRSPATRWYTQQQAIDLYKKAGFTNIRLTSEFTHEPVKDTDSVFCVLGEKSETSR